MPPGTRLYKNPGHRLANLESPFAQQAPVFLDDPGWTPQTLHPLNRNTPKGLKPLLETLKRDDNTRFIFTSIFKSSPLLFTTIATWREEKTAIVYFCLSMELQVRTLFTILIHTSRSRGF